VFKVGEGKLRLKMTPRMLRTGERDKRNRGGWLGRGEREGEGERRGWGM